MGNIAYVRPQTLNEAVQFLATNGKETEVVAGGTDVMVDLRTGAIQPRYLLDISRLDELKGIEVNEQGLFVGAGVTMSEIYVSKTLQRLAPALQKSAYNFGSKQIRNVATIGGNVAHCSPCADTIPPLVIHEARAILASKKGRREVPIERIASGAYTCSLPKDEIITRFILKPAEVDFADYQKIGRRKELTIARISMAVMARKDTDGKVAFMRFSLGACTPTPHRMTVVEDFLTSKVPTEALIWEAGRMLTERMFSITGRRASALYKEPAIQGLFLRMLYPMV
jgi:CO/xanthine dehydrogenase FAD-binding subunit